MARALRGVDHGAGQPEPLAVIPDEAGERIVFVGQRPQGQHRHQAHQDGQHAHRERCVQDTTKNTANQEDSRKARNLPPRNMR